MPGSGYRTVNDLPQMVPVFPLDGVILLPGGQLPLNIFEPRYLNMLDDAMAGERIIGMVQPRPSPDRTRPNLAPVGCAGRITSFAETHDSRYLITLTGLCRFRVGDELPGGGPYRQVRADFSNFEDDLFPADEPDIDQRQRFLAALERYLERRQMGIDWATAKAAPTDALITSLAMALPFEPAEKQALLEAPTVSDRRETLVTLLEIDSALGEDDTPGAMQ